MINNKLREVLSVLLCSVLIINTGFCTFAAAKNNDEVAEIGAAMTELPDRETRQENIQEIHNETIEQSECETVFETVHEESEPYSETAQETAASEETIRETLESETGESVLPEIEEVLMPPELEALKLQLDQIKALGINTSDYYGSFGGINVPENRRLICETAAAYKELESVMEFVEALEEGVHGFTLDDRILLDGCVDILYRCLENGGIVLYDNETGLPVVGYPNIENIEHELPNPFLRSVNPSYNGDQTITKQINCGSGSSTITIKNGASITVDLRSNDNGDAGIRIPSNGSLTITGNGILTVYGSEASNSGDNGGGAGIGGNAGESSGSLIIEDGISVISNGGSASHPDVGAGAGIGGGGGGNTKAGGNNGTVLILSGAVVEANGGQSLGKSTSGGASGGAGIGGGGGGNGAAGGYGGNIEIHGTVTANGGSCTYKEASGGAGIGGGGGGASPGPGGNSGMIVIGSSGGGTVPRVQSIGGGGGAGIGGGGSGNGNKTSNTYGGHGTTINIYSGTVYAKGSVTGDGNANVSHGGAGIGGGGFTTNSGRGSNGGDIVIGSAADVTAIGGAAHNVSGNGDRGLCGSGIGVAGENGKMPKASSGTLAISQGARVKAYSRGKLVTPQDDVSTSGHNQGDAIGTNSDTSHGEHLAIDFGRGNNCLYFQFVQKDNDIGNNYTDKNGSSQNGFKYENTGATANVIMQTFYNVGAGSSYQISAQSSATGEWFDGGTTPAGYASYAFTVGDNETAVGKPASAEVQNPYYIVTVQVSGETRQIGKWNYGNTDGTFQNRFIVVDNQVTDYIVEIGDIYIPEKPEVKMGELLIHKQVRIDEGLKDIYGNPLDLNSPYVTEAIFSIQLERLNEDGSYSPYGNVVIHGPGSKLVKLPPGKYRISERVPANYELVEIKGTGSEEGLLLYTVEIVSEELTDAIIINQLVNNRWVSDKDTVRNMLVCEIGPVT